MTAEPITGRGIHESEKRSAQILGVRGSDTNLGNAEILSKGRRDKQFCCQLPTMKMRSLTFFALVSAILVAPCLARNVEVEMLAPKQLTAALQQETYLAVFWRE